MSAAAGDGEAQRRLQKDVEFWICDNKRHLNHDAIATLRDMPPADQRRVIGGGPLEIWRDLGLLFRSRAAAGRERERELAERKGVDAAKFAREASAEELQTWLASNKAYMDGSAVREFEALDPEDKWRVVSEGPLRECVDAAYAIEQRAKHSSELASEVAEIFQKRQHQQKQQTAQARPQEALKPVVAPHIAAIMQSAYTSYVGPEVPAHQRRTSGFANSSVDEKPPLVGSTKGVGGVVEVLKQKYGCSKGQRLAVVGENGGPAGIWLLENDKSVPKTHWKDGGWRWVIEAEPASAEQKPKPAKAAKAAEAPAPEAKGEPKSRHAGKKPGGGSSGASDASRSEAEAKAKGHRKSKRKRDDSSGDSEPSRSEAKGKPKSHRKSRKRREEDSPSESDASPSAARGRPKAHRKSKKRRSGSSSASEAGAAKRAKARGRQRSGGRGGRKRSSSSGGGAGGGDDASSDSCGSESARGRRREKGGKRGSEGHLRRR